MAVASGCSPVEQPGHELGEDLRLGVTAHRAEHGGDAPVAAHEGRAQRVRRPPPGRQLGRMARIEEEPEAAVLQVDRRRSARRGTSRTRRRWTGSGSPPTRRRRRCTGTWCRRPTSPRHDVTAAGPVDAARARPIDRRRRGRCRRRARATAPGGRRRRRSPPRSAGAPTTPRRGRRAGRHRRPVARSPASGSPASWAGSSTARRRSTSTQSTSTHSACRLLEVGLGEQPGAAMRRAPRRRRRRRRRRGHLGRSPAASGRLPAGGPAAPGRTAWSDELVQLALAGIVEERHDEGEQRSGREPTGGQADRRSEDGVESEQAEALVQRHPAVDAAGIVTLRTSSRNGIAARPSAAQRRGIGARARPAAGVEPDEIAAGGATRWRTGRRPCRTGAGR